MGKFYQHVPHCLGCGTGNPKSFELRFRKEGDEVKASLPTGRDFEGPEGFVHGGAISLLIDEAAAVLAASFRGGAFLTAKLEVVFQRPVRIGETLSVSARPLRPGPRFLLAGVDVRGEDSGLVAEGRVWFLHKS